MSWPLVFAIVIACFVLGYASIGYLVERIRRNRGGEGTPPRDSRTDASVHTGEGHNRSVEDYHRSVLGVSQSAGEDEVKSAYKQLLAKYHPDKVGHLGDEFLEIAACRTKKLIEAYDYLRRKYGFR